MAALAGYGGSVLITSTSTAMTNENLTNAGDNKTFNEPTASRRYWDKTVAFVVQTAPDGSTWSTANPSTYTIRYLTGQIVFASAITGTTPSCRISSGAYLPYSTFGNMKSWEFTPVLDLYDSTTFGGGKWKTYQPGLQGGTLKLMQFWADTTFFNIVQNATTPNLFVASCLTGRNAGERFEGFCNLKQTDIKLDVAALIAESLDLQVTGQFYYFAS